MANNDNKYSFKASQEQAERIDELIEDGMSQSEAIRRLLDIALNQEESWLFVVIPKLRNLGVYSALTGVVASVLMLIGGYTWMNALSMLFSFFIIALVVLLLAEVLENNLESDVEVADESEAKMSVGE